VTAPLIYVGTKLEPEHDVKGKIVVAEGRFWGSPRNHWAFPRDHEFSKNVDIFWRAVDRGAVGMVFIASDPAWPGYNYDSLYTPSFDPAMKPIPSLLVSRLDGVQLRELAEKNRDATLVLDGTRKPGIVYNVHGILPGQSEENIIITSHLDSGFKGATEDGGGIGSVLTQAYTWLRVPIEDRPRTLIFVATASHFYDCPLGSRTFAQTHKDDLMVDNVVLINVEHVAAKMFKPEGAGLAPTGLMERMMVNYQGSDALAERLKAVLKAHPPMPVYYTLRGGSRSDLGGYLQVLRDELTYVNLQSSPRYLLTGDDTLDKIDKEWLHKTNVSITRLVETFMKMESSKFRGN
jgi:hypothetical protein